MKYLIALLLSSLCAGALQGASLVFDGTLANSGSYDNPVNAGPLLLDRDLRSPGVVYDAARGILYTRAGADRINGYTLDGRPAVSYKLDPKLRPANNDTTLRCGNLMVLFLSGNFYRLPFSAPDGAEPEKLKMALVDAETVSSSAHDGKFRVRVKTGEVYSCDPVADTAEQIGTAIPAEKSNCLGMDWDDKGRFFIFFNKHVCAFENGTLGAPQTFIGTREAGINRVAFINGCWFGGAYHGTVKRFSPDFEPAPGVVLGGGSGHFIGYVPGNYEVELPRGFAEIKPGLIAIAGLRGILHIARWDVREKRLVLLRRIGPFAEADSVAVNKDGKIYSVNGFWTWNMDNLSPAEVGVIGRLQSPVVWLTEDIFLGTGQKYGKSTLLSGRFVGGETYYFDGKESLDLPKTIIGTALYQAEKSRVFLVLGPDGKPAAFEVNPNARDPFRKKTSVSLKPKTAFIRCSGLAAKDGTTLYIAADGNVVSFTRSGSTWEQSGVLCSCGPDTTLSSDANNLLIADKTANKLKLYSFKSSSFISEVDSPSPARCALNGEFAVTWDSNGQRLLKYKLR